MSQKKVDSYKKEKASRGSRKKPVNKYLLFQKTVVGLFALLVVVWVGYSVYDLVHVDQVNTYTVDSTALDDYISEMNASITEAPAEESTDAEAESETAGETETAAETESEAQSETAEGTETETAAETETTAQTETAEETASETAK